MINSTNTVNIDGFAIDEFDLKKAFSIEQSDNFARWVVRPLGLLAAIGIGVAVFFASVFLIVVSLALLPVLAAAMWAIRTKLQRDLDNAQAMNSPLSEFEEGPVGHSQGAS